MGNGYRKCIFGSLYFRKGMHKRVGSVAKEIFGTEVNKYTRIFGEKPCVASSPLEKDDHPEIDITEYLGSDDIKKYQSVIGSLQWVISLGRFDIATAVMTLSAFRAVPGKGHLERARRVVGYLYNM
jgi:hypothetical protein